VTLHGRLVSLVTAVEINLALAFAVAARRRPLAAVPVTPALTLCGGEAATGAVELQGNALERGTPMIKLRDTSCRSPCLSGWR
jgi:hypothetical protein